jgi:hypothetical protein
MKRTLKKGLPQPRADSEGRPPVEKRPFTSQARQESPWEAPASAEAPHLDEDAEEALAAEEPAADESAFIY